MVICFKKHFPALDPVEFNGQSLERVSTAKILGVTFRNDLKWNDHVDLITSKAAKRLNLLRQLKGAYVNGKDLISFYCLCIRSVHEYACQVFHCSLTKYLCDEIERIQKRAHGPRPTAHNPQHPSSPRPVTAWRLVAHDGRALIFHSFFLSSSKSRHMHRCASGLGM